MNPAKNEKRETTYDGRYGITKSRKIRTPGEKETYKYLGILEVGTIKQEKMKERKLSKSISGERETYSKPNKIAGTLSKR